MSNGLKKIDVGDILTESTNQSINQYFRLFNMHDNKNGYEWQSNTVCKYIEPNMIYFP